MKTHSQKTLTKALLICVLFVATQIFAQDKNFVTTLRLRLTQDTDVAATAINSLGIDLLRQAIPATQNGLISPYSIQCALAMAYTGADGSTRSEMQKVLYYPADEEALRQSLAKLEKEIGDSAARSVAMAKKYPGLFDPPTFTVANSLFGQQGYEFRAAFLSALKDNYYAPFQPVDFVHDAPGATKQINLWVEEKTHQHIRDIVPADALGDLTRLVLVNAVYFKASWGHPFEKSATKPLPFYAANGGKVKVLTMAGEAERFGYAKCDGFVALTMPYSFGSLQFLILLPNRANGLPALEKKLTADLLRELASIEEREVIIYMPKLHIEPPTIPLSDSLLSLGMKLAFDKPPGSANFDRMAPRRLNEYLHISAVFHKTFLDLDENGTEAAAATAETVITLGMAHEKPQPIKVHVDHPFLFAIQHRKSGACLFLGRITTVPGK